jgi:hypothetical protein
MVRDMILEAVETHFTIIQAPLPLADNCSVLAARVTRDFALAIKRVPCFTLAQSPESMR